MPFEQTQGPGEENFFSGEFGLLCLDAPYFSTLGLRYPRKLGPVLQRLYDLRLRITRAPAQIAAAAARAPSRQKILIVGVEVASRPAWMARVVQRLSASRHEITVATKDVDGTPRLANLNLLLASHEPMAFDWIIVVDDDVELPEGFTDNFIFLMDHFGFSIGQPAHNLVSHASYLINLRHWGTIARQTGYVEVGPLVALRRETFAALLPFPEIGMGWGVDVHWSYLAKRNGWRQGVVDALPIRHVNPVGASYNSGEARRQATEFVATHGGLPRREALRTIRSFKRL